MMDYTDLVKRLRKKAIDLPEKFSKNADTIDLVMRAAEAIEKLQAAQKWIPVTERLPIRGDRVICFGDNGINTVDFVCGDKWCALPWFYLDGEQETGITHWMPLPVPPKEEA